MKQIVQVKKLFLSICLILLSVSISLAQIPTTTTTFNPASTTTTIKDTIPPPPPPPQPCGLVRPCPCEVEYQDGRCPSFMWEGDSEADLADYRISYGTLPEHYDYFIDVGIDRNSFAWCGFPEGITYYIKITAIDVSNNEIELPNCFPFALFADDGISYEEDNCPDITNSQSDFDEDGLGDLCDNCRFVPNPNQADFDRNGTGNACEPTIDIKPGSCPNPLNLESKGVLPVAILGAEEFDVTNVDPDSIRLSSERVLSGVPPIRIDFEDVGTPFGGEPCECHDLNVDGYMDLTLRFDVPELVETLLLNEENCATIPLMLTANLMLPEHDFRLQAKDCIRVQLQCRGDFDSDNDVDGNDAIAFKRDFGRNTLGNPCNNDQNPCNGDFDSDMDVDGNDALVFKANFGRSPLNNPCLPTP